MAAASRQRSRVLQVLLLMRKKENGELEDLKEKEGRVIGRRKLQEERELARGCIESPHARITWRALKKLASISLISFSETTLERLAQQSMYNNSMTINVYADFSYMSFITYEESCN